MRFVAIGLSVLALCATPAAQAQPMTDSSSHDEDSRAAEYARLVELAVRHFRAGEYSEARSAFDNALPFADADAERATLTFNAAVAAYEAGDFEDAERRFVASAHYDPTTRSLCHVYAGLAAVGAGALTRARDHLSRSSPGDAASSEKRAALAQALLAAESRAKSAALVQALARAHSAYGRGQLERAETELQLVSSMQAFATKLERASLHWLLGSIARRRGQLDLAQEHFERALEYDPAAPDLLVALGDLATDRDDPSGARRYYERAHALTRDSAERKVVDERIDALFPIPAGGPLLLAEVTGGVDSNAAQSGAASAVGASGDGDQSSALSRVSLSFDWVFRTGRRTALAPGYAGTSLQLFQPQVAELSFQTHEPGVFFYWAPSERLALRLNTSVALAFIGQSQPEAFSMEPGGGARLDAAHDALWSTGLWLDMRRIKGLNGRDALTGRRVTFSARETASFREGALWAEAAAGENGMGVSQQATSSDDFEICSTLLLEHRGGPCVDGNLYSIPLGYRFAALSLGSSYQLSRWTLGGSAKVEYRNYLQDSVLVIDPMGRGPYGAPPEYHKRREDVRYSGTLRLSFALDQARNYSAVANYALLVSTSNIAQSEGGAEHALDYDDRNFTQHVLELGLGARFR